MLKNTSFEWTIKTKTIKNLGWWLSKQQQPTGWAFYSSLFAVPLFSLTNRLTLTLKICQNGLSGPDHEYVWLTQPPFKEDGSLNLKLFFARAIHAPSRSTHSFYRAMLRRARIATASRLSVSPSVNVEVPWSHRLEIFKNNITIS